MSKQNFEFQAEVGKILNIVANSLYSDKEIFIREYISNASDACDKLRYAQLKDPSLMKKGEEFKILVTANKKNNVLEISDNGIGMTKDELIESLGTIAKSGTEDFIKKMEKENGFAEAINDKETGKKKQFFNLGPENDWKKLLDIKLKEDIEREFDTEMRELGYI